MNSDYDITRKRISIKQANNLIKKNKGVLNVEITNNYLNNTYTLNDGKVVVLFDTHGFLYNSLNDLKSWIAHLQQKRSIQPASHILDGKLLFGENFLLHKDELVDTVVNLFNLSGDILSIFQLKIIDERMNQRDNRIQVNSKLFTALTAYVGEIIRKHYPGSQWLLQKSDLNNLILEPYILFNKIKYNPFIVVYKELYEEFPETNVMSLFEQLDIELNKK